MATAVKKTSKSVSNIWKFLIGLAAIVSCLVAVVPEWREPLERLFSGNWVRLETMEISTVAYSGDSDPILGNSRGTLTTIDSASGTEYWLDYEIPEPTQVGQAGLEFKFLKLKDLSSYKYIKFTIDFVSPEGQVGFYFENANENGRGDAKTLSKTVKLEGATIVSEGKEKYTFQIPLDLFTNTNMKNVSEFGFYINNELTTGKGKFMVTNLQFGNQ